MSAIERYQPYYEKLSLFAAFRFLFDAALSRDNLQRLSLKNRSRDYQELIRNPALLPFHRAINAELVQARREWKSHDYGEGYFYQGYRPLRITGLRDTEARFAEMGLEEWTRDRTVLDIGTNAGFMALSIAKHARSVDALDVNPHLIAIANRAAAFQGIGNAHFAVSAFEDYADRTSGAGYEVICSFANHSTYDNNTRHSLIEYVDRCRTLLAPGGHLLFESHAPGYERERLQPVLQILREHFVVVEERTLTGGTFLDRGRTFVVGRKP